MTLGPTDSIVDGSTWVSALTPSERATLRLPSEVGVRVDVKSALGTVVGLGLTRQGESYVNAAYGSSDVTLQVNMQPGIGLINLEVEETAVTN